MIFFPYDPDWPHGIPRSEPPYSYEYVKDLRYTSIQKVNFVQKFPIGKGRLKHAFISANQVIYQLQFHGVLTSVYQMCFENETQENIDNFVAWLKSHISE